MMILEQLVSNGSRALQAWSKPLCGALLVMAACGCGHLFVRSSQPKAKVSSLKPTAGESVPVQVLEIEVMRFADNYPWSEAEAADDFVATASSPEARIAAEQQRARALLVETRQTLNAASDTAMSFHATIGKLEEFVRYVSPPDTDPAPASPNAHPFNVLDYGTAANEIGRAARDLDALLRTANTSLPNLNQQMTAGSELVLRRAFTHGLILILVLLVGLVVAGLTYRALDRRLSGDKGAS